MKIRLLVFLVLVMFLASSLVHNAMAFEGPYWVDGQAYTTPVLQSYSSAWNASLNRFVLANGTNYYCFNETVISSNSSAIVATQALRVCVPVALITAANASVPVDGGYYNFSGVIAFASEGFPASAFVVTQIAVKHLNWEQSAIGIIEALSGIVKGIAIALCQVIFVVTGYEIPEWIMTLAIVAVAAYVFVKGWKTWTVVFLIVLAFLILSGGLNLLRMLILHSNT